MSELMQLINNLILVLFLLGYGLMLHSSYHSNNNNLRGNAISYMMVGVIGVGLLYLTYKMATTTIGNITSAKKNFNNMSFTNTSLIDSLSITTGHNCITVSNDCCNGKMVCKDVTVKNVTKKIILNDRVNIISIPSALAQVTIVEDNESSYIECDEAVYSSDLKFCVVDGTLKLCLPVNLSITFKNFARTSLVRIFAHVLDTSLSINNCSHVTINTPFIEHLNVFGAAMLFTNDTIMHTLKKLNVSGASIVKIPKLYGELFEATISGASKVEVSGIINKQLLIVRGASKYIAPFLLSATADVAISGASTAQLHVSMTFSGKANGASTIAYSGNANNSIQITGASSCKKSR